MPAPPSTLAAGPAPQPPFVYIGGDASLDLVNTVDWTARGPANERLTDYERLRRWADGAGLLAATEAERLRRTAAARPQAAAAVCAQAQRLRAVLRQVFRSVAAREDPGAAGAELDRWLARALRSLRVVPRRRPQVAEWGWREPAGLDAILLRVVWLAARLLTSTEAARIRTCAGPDCGWMYVDRSRNRLRRWCRMETCGTREKSRRRRERNRRLGPSEQRAKRRSGT